MPGFNVSKITLGDVKDVHRAHRWIITKVVGKSLNNMLFYAKELTPPSVGFEEELVLGASVDYKFPKKATFDDVTMTFYDVHGLFAQLEALRASVWSPEGGLQTATNYMGETEFSKTDGSGSVVGTWTLYNSYIKQLSHSQLSYTDTSIKTVTATLSYTWAKYA